MTGISFGPTAPDLIADARSSIVLIVRPVILLSILPPSALNVSRNVLCANPAFEGNPLETVDTSPLPVLLALTASPTPPGTNGVIAAALSTNIPPASIAASR